MILRIRSALQPRARSQGWLVSENEKEAGAELVRTRGVDPLLAVYRTWAPTTLHRFGRASTVSVDHTACRTPAISGVQTTRYLCMCCRRGHLVFRWNKYSTLPGSRQQWPRFCGSVRPFAFSASGGSSRRSRMLWVGPISEVTVQTGWVWKSLVGDQATPPRTTLRCHLSKRKRPQRLQRKVRAGACRPSSQLVVATVDVCHSSAVTHQYNTCLQHVASAW